jgi:shikimate kinase
MGAGKTSVGQALARKLNWSFEDLDDRIIARQGRSIAEIFRESGESAFRQFEHAALRAVLAELQTGSARVVALGGGAFAQEENAALLREAGFPTVFLEAPVQTLWQRCCRQADQTGAERPLLQNMSQFRELYDARRRAYVRASRKIATAARTVEAVAARIARTLALKPLMVRSEKGDLE